MNEFGNQYGINLGAIDQSISQKKTAEQNLEFNKQKMNAFNREENKNISSDKAEQDYLKNPSTAIASSIKQATDWHNLDISKKQELATALKMQNEKEGTMLKGILDIQDPVQQKQAIVQMVANMPPLQQQAFTKQYGQTPEEMQANIPHAFTNALNTSKGLVGMEKEVLMEKEYGLRGDVERVKQEGISKKQEAQNQFTAGQNELNRRNSSNNANIGAGSREENAKARNEISAQTLEERKIQNERHNTLQDEAMKDRRMQKFDKTAAMTEGYDNLSPEDKQIVSDTYRETGKMPKMKTSGHMFWKDTKLENMPQPETPKGSSSNTPSREEVLQMAQERGKDPQAALKAFGY